jgi:hypothetical protein
MENKSILWLFLLHGVISEYFESIVSYMESTRKESKRLWRMMKEYLPYIEYADRNCRKKPKKTYHATPL